MAKRTCEKCGRTKEDTAFYTYKNGEKTELCKDCMTMHVNIWQPDTFMWLLEKMDVPYVPNEWNSLRDAAYAKDPSKKNNIAVFGKYLSKMKLKQWKDKGWADSEALQKEYELKKQAEQQAEKSAQQEWTKKFEEGQITEAQYRTLVAADTQRSYDIAHTPVPDYEDFVGKDNMFNEKKFMKEQDIPDLGEDLTEEDRKYLVLKWGRYYTPSEWVELEKFYNEMMNSFDIQDADTRSTLILICKNNLKMNQAIDQGDLEGYQKLARVSDQLRKSAKFTAAQNKEQKSEFIDSIGELVDYCEKHGGAIPKIEITEDQDLVDQVISDLKAYTKSLIYEDTALARQIEDYLKKRERILEQRKDEEEAKRLGVDVIELTDSDISDYNAEIERQREIDAAALNQEEDALSTAAEVVA